VEYGKIQRAIQLELDAVRYTYYGYRTQLDTVKYSEILQQWICCKMARY